MALHLRRSLDNRLFNQENHSFTVQCQTKRIKSAEWAESLVWDQEWVESLVWDQARFDLSLK